VVKIVPGPGLHLVLVLCHPSLDLSLLDLEAWLLNTLRFCSARDEKALLRIA
jgi:hypothetical protein